MASIRTLLLEMVDSKGASHIRELHIEIMREKPGTPEHTIRARLVVGPMIRTVAIVRWSDLLFSALSRCDSS